MSDPRPGRLGRAVLTALSVTLACPAQDPAQDLDGPPQVVVQNLTPHPRTEWVATVVPFTPGQASGDAPDYHVADHATTWQPYGGRWADGSLRQAIALYRPRLAASSEVQLELRPGAGPQTAGSPSFGLPPHLIRCEVVVGGERHTATLMPSGFLERNAARQIVILRARIGGSGVVVEAPLTIWDRQAHGELGVGVFFSDPTRPDMQVQIDELALIVEGMAWMPRHARPLGVTGGPTARGSRHVLLRDSALGDGQGLRRVGALVPPLAPDDQREFNDTLQAAASCPPLSACSWTASGAFGAFGFVPEPPPWLRADGALRRAMARRHNDFVRWSRSVPPDPFRVPIFGPPKVPAQAGYQADFGVIAAEPVAWSGLPSFLHELELSVLQEGCRPVHNFEADAQPVLSARHPDWVVWDGRTHWNHKSSPDRLGKSAENQRFESHGWRGKDREHWSSNFLCAYALLTAAPDARLEIANEVQLYLAAQTLDPKLYTSKPGVSRAAGRTMLAATWLWLCTGDDALLERMRRRMHDVNLPSWATRDVQRPGRMRPFQVRSPDPRYLDVPEAKDITVWVPWEESLTVTGFAAYLALTGDPDPDLREMTDQIALTILAYATREDRDYGAQIAYAMAWNDGLPPVGAERDDPHRVKWPSAGFGVWAMGSLEVARDAAKRRGDAELEERAVHLLERLRARRGPPKDGFYDRLSQWDGVRIGSD